MVSAQGETGNRDSVCREQVAQHQLIKCLSRCAFADHARAKALKRRGMSKGPKRYPKRSNRIELTGLRAEAASRDFVRELRA